MHTKSRPNHLLYLKSLQRMTPAQRLSKAFELSDFARQLFVEGLRKRFSNLSPEEFQDLLLMRLKLCHNRNY
jgi:hypothetical protein